MPLSEQTGPELKQTEQRKDESKIIHILIWQRRMTASDGSKAYELDLSTHCGRSAGRPFYQTRRVREVDYSSAPSLTQFGKTQIRGLSRCQGLRGLGTPMAPPKSWGPEEVRERGGLAKWNS